MAATPSACRTARPLDAALRSVLVPGAGQRHMGSRWRALAFGTSVMAFAAGGIAAYDEYLSADRKQADVQRRYDAATTEQEFAILGPQLAQAADDTDEWKVKVWTLFGVTRAAYIWNVLDAMSMGASGWTRSAVDVSVVPRADGMVASLTWRLAMKRHAPAMSRSAILLSWMLALCLGGCAQDPEPPSYDNPFDPRNGQGMPVPDSLFVYVGNNAVQLYWGCPTMRPPTSSPCSGSDSTSSTMKCCWRACRSFRDTGVRTGQAYAYRISAGQNGRFGPRSEPLRAQPGVFSIVIAGNAPKTRIRTVTISFNAPSGDAVRLSEDLAQLATTRC